MNSQCNLKQRRSIPKEKLFKTLTEALHVSMFYYRTAGPVASFWGFHSAHATVQQQSIKIATTSSMQLRTTHATNKQMQQTPNNAVGDSTAPRSIRLLREVSYKLYSLNTVGSSYVVWLFDYRPDLTFNLVHQSSKQFFLKFGRCAYSTMKALSLSYFTIFW